MTTSKYTARIALAVCAVASVIYATNRMGVASGILVGVTFCCVAVVTARFRPPFFTAAMILVACISLWFGAIDSFVSFHECPKCYRSVIRVDRRIMGVTITTFQRRTHPGTDTCHHSLQVLWQNRYLGLLICACPCEASPGIKTLH